MTEKQKAPQGGNEDGIGLAQDVTKPSTWLNDCDSSTSNVGKILKIPKPANE